MKYKIDNKATPVHTLHIGKETPEYIETLLLSEGEDLEYISCSYSDDGIHTLTFKTNTGEFFIHFITALS